jgi:hypothetical protein
MSRKYTIAEALRAVYGAVHRGIPMMAIHGDLLDNGFEAKKADIIIRWAQQYKLATRPAFKKAR